VEAVVQEGWAVLGKPAPIFKLIAPDGTGGSREAIFRNPHQIFTVVKKVNFLADVTHLTVTDPWYGGSYNYSETVKVGYSAHERRDVVPHNENPFNGIYINPPSRHSLLVDRVFPERGKGDSLPLAKQV
jgi:hypothetical protein